MGTISSIDLRHHHPDLLEMCKQNPGQATLEAANQTALRREIIAAKALGEGRGMIAVNVMRAVSSYAAAVQTACESGADAIVMGAGLPLDLPDLTQGVDIALIPILSDSRGIALVLKKWLKKNRLPDAIVIEHPGHAGGHLGVASVADIPSERFDFARVIEETMLCDNVAVIVALVRGVVAKARQISEDPLCALVLTTRVQVSPPPVTPVTVVLAPLR